MNDLILASSNAGKLREFSSLLAPLGWRVRPQRELSIPDAPEPHATFVENALAKARNASAHSGLPALADDSGLCVDALAGAPGVRSARWAGERSDDRKNNEKLIADLQAIGAVDWSAEYACVLVLARSADDPFPLVAQASWRGRIIAEARGKHGFGYDAHFLLPSLGYTAAELDPDEKDHLSHRGRATRALIAQWTERQTQ